MEGGREGWRDGGRDGRMVRWREEGMEGWKEEGMVRWRDGCDSHRWGPIIFREGFELLLSPSQASSLEEWRDGWMEEWM